MDASAASGGGGGGGKGGAMGGGGGGTAPAPRVAELHPLLADPPVSGGSSTSAVAKRPAEWC